MSVVVNGDLHALRKFIKEKMILFVVQPSKLQKALFAGQFNVWLFLKQTFIDLDLEGKLMQHKSGKLPHTVSFLIDSLQREVQDGIPCLVFSTSVFLRVAVVC